MTSHTVSNEELNQKLNLILEHLKFHEKRFDEIDRRHLMFEKQFEKIDQQFEKVDQQFEKIDHQFAEVRKDMDHRFAEVRKDMDQQFEKVDHQFAEVRQDIAVLSNTRLTWSAGVLSGVVIASSILTLILLRILSAIGLKIADLGVISTLA